MVVLHHVLPLWNASKKEESLEVAIAISVELDSLFRMGSVSRIHLSAHKMKNGMALNVLARMGSTESMESVWPALKMKFGMDRNVSAIKATLAMVRSALFVLPMLSTSLQPISVNAKTLSTLSTELVSNVIPTVHGIILFRLALAMMVTMVTGLNAMSVTPPVRLAQVDQQMNVSRAQMGPQAPAAAPPQLLLLLKSKCP